MGRKSGVWYWSERGRFASTVEGKRIPLTAGPNDKKEKGPTYQAALKELAKVMTGRSLSVRGLCDQYLSHLAGKSRSATVDNVRRCLDALCEVYGDMYAESLTAEEVERWLARQGRAEWARNTRRLYISAVLAVYRWGCRKGFLPRDQMDGQLVKPPAVYRGRKYALLSKDESAVLAAARPALRELIQFMKDTGARPQEARKVGRGWWDPAIPGFRLSADERCSDREGEHKTGRTGKDRIIVVSGPSLPTVQRLLERYPEGPIFRTGRSTRGAGGGRASGWTARALGRAFRRLRQRTGVRFLVAYSVRHGFAVRALENGEDPDALATFMGSSREMLAKCYGHLDESYTYLRAMAERIRGYSAEH